MAAISQLAQVAITCQSPAGRSTCPTAARSDRGIGAVRREPGAGEPGGGLRELVADAAQLLQRPGAGEALAEHADLVLEQERQGRAVLVHVAARPTKPRPPPARRRVSAMKSCAPPGPATTSSPSSTTSLKCSPSAATISGKYRVSGRCWRLCRRAQAPVTDAMQRFRRTSARRGTAPADAAPAGRASAGRASGAPADSMQVTGGVDAADAPLPSWSAGADHQSRGRRRWLVQVGHLLTVEMDRFPADVLLDAFLRQAGGTQAVDDARHCRRLGGVVVPATGRTIIYLACSPVEDTEPVSRCA